MMYCVSGIKKTDSVIHVLLILFKRKALGVPLWCSRLRIWPCHCNGSSARVRSLAWELPRAAGVAKNKLKSEKKTLLI